MNITKFELMTYLTLSGLIVEGDESHGELYEAYRNIRSRRQS